MRIALSLAMAVLLPVAPARGQAADELTAIVKTWLTKTHPAGWSGVDDLPGIKWAALPPQSLQNCLPDGGCYTRQGVATLGGQSLAVIATGARQFVFHIYFRNPGRAIGEAAVVAALKGAGLGAELKRCPVRGGAGTTNWYRLSGGSPGYLSIQTVRGARASEGFVLTAGDELPKLQPNQLALYSEQCGAGATQTPVSTLKPHERLAEVVTALLVPANSQGLGWKELAALPTDIEWLGEGPKPMALTHLNDPNPVGQTGTVTWADRKFSVVASGTATQVKAIHLEEMGLHPRGEHMLGVVYTKGIAVRLVRCGPVYTESTNNWYSLNSNRTRPAMIRQSIRYDGSSVQDSYQLRLDGTLPPRDPRDRDPGVNGCQ